MQKKYDASQFKNRDTSFVQNMMAIKNKEIAKLAMIQKIDILNKQIDTAEERPDFDSANPSARWLFATECVEKLMKEYKNMDVVVQSHEESFLSPQAR
jgi:hypothetical protein